MSKKLKLIKIIKESISDGHMLIRFDYQLPRILENYVKEELFVEIPCSADNIPDAILTIPFVGVMLTVSMLLDLEIEVPTLDQRFYLNINKLKKVYEQMYPKADLNIKVNVNELVDCTEETSGSALFFTGGVDATSALIDVINKTPVLINIWGGDIRLSDEKSHDCFEKYLNQFSSDINLKYVFIKTNSREMFDENKLDYLTKKIVGKNAHVGWWDTIAHTISMLSSAAPWIYKEKIKECFLGSSYAVSEDTFDANNSDVLHALSFASSDYYNVDVDLVRNDKVKKIVEWRELTKIPFELKVCWYRKASENCSNCEKCYRTIMNIISNKGNPNDYGFKVDSDTFIRMKNYLNHYPVTIQFWKSIQDEFKKDEAYWSKLPDIAWFLNFKFNNKKVFVSRATRRIKRTIRIH